MALIRGDLQALALLPKILAKRWKMRRLRRLSTWQILRLLWRYRITLKELSQQSI
jgi:hypothetical protein